VTGLRSTAGQPPRLEAASDGWSGGKRRDAARRWANYVNADEKVGGTRWRYLLLSESDVKTAKGSWEALKALGGES
jgi:hypothetical protein